MEALKDRIRQDLTAAMRARDEAAKSALRGVLTAISRAEVSGRQQAALTEDQIIGVIRSEVGKRKEAAEIYEGAGRQELAARERAEAEVLSPYLPTELSDETLASIVDEELGKARESGVEGPRALGVVIKAVRARVGTQAEGSRIARAVKSALALP